MLRKIVLRFRLWRERKLEQSLCTQQWKAYMLGLAAPYHSLARQRAQSRRRISYLLAEIGEEV